MNFFQGNVISSFLKKKLLYYDLDFLNCRSQRYNWANIKVVHKELLRTRSLFVTCGHHNLNFVLSNATKTSVPSVTLFKTIQRFCAYSSTQGELLVKTRLPDTCGNVCGFTNTSDNTNVSSVIEAKYIKIKTDKYLNFLLEFKIIVLKKVKTILFCLQKPVH